MRSRHIIFYLLLFYCSQLHTQSSESTTEIKAVIDQLFDGMRAGDSMAIRGIFAPQSNLSSIFTNQEGEVVKRTTSTSKFVSAVGQAHDEIWDEQIWSYDINIDDPMAYAWTEYTFYIGEKLSHCGVNVFEMIHLSDGWKIGGITDTRRTTNCKTKGEADIDKMMNEWHDAASRADEKLFFETMTHDGIYIGTDEGERWTRDEMKEWSKNIFERESAWSFSTINRNVSIDPKETIGWFDELLDTWMGTCRGSGVVVKTPDGWKIKYYHLSIAVPNEKVDGYLDLIGKPRRN